MRGYAHIVVCGNAVRDSEQKDNFCEVVVAVNDGFGEKKRVSFFRCVGFGNTYQVLQYVKKGDPVLIAGTPVLQKHDGKTYFSIVIDKITLLTGKKAEGNGKEVSLADMIEGVIDPAKDDFDF